MAGLSVVLLDKRLVRSAWLAIAVMAAARQRQAAYQGYNPLQKRLHGFTLRRRSVIRELYLMCKSQGCSYSDSQTRCH